MTRIVTSAFACVLACSMPMFAQTSGPQPVAIEHVSVLPMTPDGVVLEDATVVIRNGRIASIERSAKAPAGVRRIDGTGKWLMPALTDMHVHLENDRMMRLYLHADVPDGTLCTRDIVTPYLVNGVLQILDLSAMPETIGQKIEIESGKVLGPHIMTAAMIDGANPFLPFGITRVAATPEAGRQAVSDAAAEGYEFIKAYGNLDLPTFSAIVDEARRRKMRVVGHIPQRGQGMTEKFFQPGYDLVAHVEEFGLQTAEPSIADIPRYVDMAKRNGTWVISTLSLDERILEVTRNPESLKSRAELHFLVPPFYPVVVDHNPYLAQASPDRITFLEHLVDFNRKLVQALSAAGVPVLAGTDSPVPGVVPGFSMPDELEAMGRAGLSNRQVLEGATRLPSEWLGVMADRGEVAVGKRADLLLLDGNPLESLSNIRRISAVIDGGRYLSRADLDRRLHDLGERYARMRKDGWSSVPCGCP